MIGHIANELRHHRFREDHMEKPERDQPSDYLVDRAAQLLQV